MALEEKSVDEAFARSVLFGFDVEIREDNRVLIDITDFLLQDAHAVAISVRNDG